MEQKQEANVPPIFQRQSYVSSKSLASKRARARRKRLMGVLLFIFLTDAIGNRRRRSTRESAVALPIQGNGGSILL